MNDARQLRDMYRQTVLDHSRNPRNFRPRDTADRQIEGHNPLCGDKVTIYFQLNGENIQDLAFEGTGCAICMASASIMTEVLTDLPVSDAQREIDHVLRDFQISEAPARPVSGEMAALAGVRDYPSRIKCAILAWQTLAAGLRNEDTLVTTED
jgi:nitrogen fixation NifU-like protein